MSSRRRNVGFIFRSWVHLAFSVLRGFEKALNTLFPFLTRKTGMCVCERERIYMDTHICVYIIFPFLPLRPPPPPQGLFCSTIPCLTSGNLAIRKEKAAWELGSPCRCRAGRAGSCPTQALQGQAWVRFHPGLGCGRHSLTHSAIPDS